MALNPKQIKALQCLLAYPTKKEAAKAAGIAERTLRSYLANEEFQAEYKKAFGMIVTEATRQAQKALSPAITLLLNVVNDENETAGNCISAARSILEYGLKLTEFNDILQDLEALEG